VPVSGHDKELFFRKWGEISGLGVYPSLCELVEGIVTVPLDLARDANDAEFLGFADRQPVANPEVGTVERTWSVSPVGGCDDLT
jgi:hypothetical protein